MNVNFCNIHYRTEYFEDRKEGCSGLELLAGGSEVQVSSVGKITFWDASGQFFIQLDSVEVPLEILEKFIAEAKKKIAIA